MTASGNSNAWDEAKAAAEKRMGISHRGGVSWAKAPLPPLLHRCSSQTTSLAMGVERCACGATSFDGGRHWTGKNERRDSE